MNPPPTADGLHTQAPADGFTGDDRVLVIAPHPDDESLACAGLLQHAAEAGAALRILFLTDGENNPWAQRATELRLVLTDERRRRFGERRRREVASALLELGVDPAAASFVGLPDQGLTSLLMKTPHCLLDPIRDEIERMAPTVLAQPSLADLHPDHSAAAVAVDMALPRARVATPRRLAYVIHRPVVEGAVVPSTTVPLDADECEKKRRAILAHRTQHRLRGPWLVSFAREQESYVDDLMASTLGHPVVEVRAEGPWLQLRVESRNHPRAFGGRTLALLIDGGPEREVTCATMPLRRRDATGVQIHSGSSLLLDGARWEGRRGRGLVTVPQGLPAGAAGVYAKILRRFGFFDEAGWRRVGP